MRSRSCRNIKTIHNRRALAACCLHAHHEGDSPEPRSNSTLVDRRRLRRVAKMMEQYGARVQRSAFECRLDKKRMACLLDDIKRVINRKQDKVAVITLCQPCVHRSERFVESGFTTDADVYVC